MFMYLGSDYNAMGRELSVFLFETQLLIFSL